MLKLKKRIKVTGDLSHEVRSVNSFMSYMSYTWER